MNVALRPRMTVAEFLAWEERQPLRYEFDGMKPVAMTGGTAAHARLQRNLAISIGGRLRGTACELMGSDLKVEVAGSVRYPDASVSCTRVENASTVSRKPVVVVEVLSGSISGTDRITKNHEYAATPSIQRYVMLEQDRVAATVFARRSDAWAGELLTGDAVLHLPEIRLDLLLAELYESLDLPADPDAPQGEPSG